MPNEAVCIHHWRCGDPAGDWVPSDCLKCGLHREFPRIPLGMRDYQNFMVAGLLARQAEPFARVRFGAHFETGLAR